MNLPDIGALRQPFQPQLETRLPLENGAGQPKSSSLLQRTRQEGEHASRCQTIVSTCRTLLLKSADTPQGAHPLLQQTPLSVNPFIDLPKAPTLPHNYASLPSTLPPSTLSAQPSASAPDFPAYVTSSSGFAAHPSTIVAQNKALLEQLDKQKAEARTKVEEWENSIRERELQEKRRKAPGWLDSEARILEPERKKEEVNLMDDGVDKGDEGLSQGRKDKEVDDLGNQMDRAFGRSEMG